MTGNDWKNLYQARINWFFIRIWDFAISLSYGLVMVIKRTQFKKSNKQAQRVFNKMYTNESTNRERIRFLVNQGIRFY